MSIYIQKLYHNKYHKTQSFFLSWSSKIYQCGDAFSLVSQLKSSILSQLFISLLRPDFEKSSSDLGYDRLYGANPTCLQSSMIPYDKIIYN